MPGYLGSFPNSWVSGKFSKCLGIWEFSQMPILIKNVNAVVSWVKSKKGTPAAKSKMVPDKKNVFQ